MSDLPRTGWIGTGRMGFELALRLLNAGVPLAVWNRTRQKAEPLVELGAVLVDRPADLAGCDAVLSILSDSAVFEDVMLGEGGLLTDPDRVPAVVADSSTISAEASARVRAAAEARGAALLAAPVSGSPKVIEAGRLGVVVSGDRDAFERVRQLLAHYGAKVAYVGEGDRARLVKICHNLILGVLYEALVETTLLAHKAGVTRADFLEFINGSVVGTVFSGYKTPAMVTLDWTPLFTSVGLRKDFELGLDAARELDVPLPAAAAMHQRLVDLIGNGYGDVDFAALLELAASGAGLELRPEDRAVDYGMTPVDDLSARRPTGA